MPIDRWLTFVAATAVLLSIPGPTTLLVVSHAITHGRSAARATVAGVTLGDLTALTASMLGLGAALATSAMLFAAVKVVGGAYLIFLGIRLLRAPVEELNTKVADPGAPGVEPGRIFFHAYSVTALNPKSIVFFVAFLPQFADTSRPIVPQLFLLGATFFVMSLTWSSLWSVFGSFARGAVRKPRTQRIVNRSGGAMMIGAGVLALAWKR
jgi:threonine/homoserine/homoserine lactone efflux protein